MTEIVNFLNLDGDTGLSAGHLSTLDHDLNRMDAINNSATHSNLNTIMQTWSKLKAEVISVIDQHHDEIHISLDVNITVECPLKQEHY